jgi:DNA-3-methyladenine glycosylase II
VTRKARTAAPKRTPRSGGDGRSRGREVWKGAYERLLGDPRFRPLVMQVGPVRLQSSAADPFAFLVRAVTYQQLAGKAAATIHGRLVTALGGTVDPAAVRRASDEALRGAGLSRSKLASIRDLAAKVSDGTVALDGLNDMGDAELIEHLVQVRGIGRWTAEMLLLFHLRRPDVWPVGDLGVRAGMARVMGWDKAPSDKELELIGVGYRPWRSATAWYCWRAVELLPPA